MTDSMRPVQILFVHPNFPAQFGPLLSKLSELPHVHPVFVTRNIRETPDHVRIIRFETKGGATKHTHYCSRTFENAVWNAHAIYEACKAAPDLDPDLIVGHSGFGTTVFLRELYRCPIVNLFEYYYHPHGSDLDFRPERVPPELNFLRSYTRNAMILLDLTGCTAGYTPTPWQWSLLPEAFRSKVEIIHDGIDTQFWRRRRGPRRLGDEELDADTRVVTYVARGLESMRGFDIFIRVAKQIAARMPNVIFVVAGSDRSHYGNDGRYIRTRSFREHVLQEEQPDLSRFRFLGTVSREQLANVLSLSDVHIYLTVPFVLSWSLLDALACECTVVASDTAPVREVIHHGNTGLLADFFDVEGLSGHALDVLGQPTAFSHLARNGRTLVESEYSLEKTFPRLWDLCCRSLR